LGRAVLIIASRAADRRELEQMLRAEGFVAGVATVASLAVVVLDDHADAHVEVSSVRERMRGGPMIVVGPPSVDVAVASMSAGASDYLARPLDGERLRLSAARIAVARTAPRAVRKGDVLIGESPAMRAVLAALDRAASSAMPVLITGESGTGKELAARALHYTGKRRTGPFVAINAGAIAESLAEAELFGVRRGAYTGADRDRVGVFVEAHGGTLFLDEIATASPALQVKLLRVLERGEVVPVGSPKPVVVDVRVVAATNSPLRRAVTDGTFREDLFYRLAAVHVQMPTLRERPEDLALIAAHHLSILAAKTERMVPRVSVGALARLMSHAWPGNVRELVNVLGNAMIVCRAGVIRAEDIQLQDEPAPMSVLPFREARRRFEEAYVRSVLAAAGGRIAEAARLAARERKDFYQLCKRAGVDLSVYRVGASTPDEAVEDEYGVSESSVTPRPTG